MNKKVTGFHMFNTDVESRRGSVHSLYSSLSDLPKNSSHQMQTTNSSGSVTTDSRVHDMSHATLL